MTGEQISRESRAPRFTILLPVTRSPELLPYAIESVAAQSVADFELFVVCDGAPATTVDCASRFATGDARISVFPFPKGERNGELHRHAVLSRAAGKFVAQLGDDDIWFPEHLAELGTLLDAVDFGNLLQMEVLPNSELFLRVGDLASAAIRQRMMSSVWNFFGPTVSGYRLSAYRSLPVGWSPAPAGIWSDLFMWRKFLGKDGLTFGTRFSIQAAKLSAGRRRTLTMGERLAETERYARLLSSEPARRTMAAEALKSMYQAMNDRVGPKETEKETTIARLAAEAAAAQRDLDHALQRIERLQSSRSWRLTAPLRRIGSTLQRLLRKRRRN